MDMDSGQETMRFGMLAVQKGFVSSGQIVDALELQVKENFSSGKHRLIGEILLDLGFIDGTQLDEIVQILH
ncbi:MAG: hypothetical protein ABII06_00375 [Pseudomonadota bacterium]